MLNNIEIAKALRQPASKIIIGEIRNEEGMKELLEAMQTGHYATYPSNMGNYNINQGN